MDSYAYLARGTHNREHRSGQNWSDGAQCAGESRLPAETARTLDELRHAVEWNLEGAPAVALRLATLLTQPNVADPTSVRGGLAAWQKRKVDRYMQEHLEQPLRVEELADLLSLSVSHFSRAFKESFGSSPHVHVIKLRLELAQRLMLTTEDSLSQIALACGLADQAHLSKLFRRQVGETPSAWRRQRLTVAQAEARRRPPTATMSELARAGQFSGGAGRVGQAVPLPTFACSP